MLSRTSKVIINKCGVTKSRFLSISQFNFLPYKEDKFNGVIVDADQLPANAARFSEVLKSSLSSWTNDNKSCVWLKISLRNATFIEHAANQGFEFHHAEPTYVVMNKWLSKTEENKIPISASHQVGVGSIVFNENNELLLVQERLGNTMGKNVWKFPTGLLDLGENLNVGAEREVLEETGVKTKFQGILAFRQNHNVLFGKSGMFFLCLMELADKHETKISMQESELVGCEWRDAKEWAGQKYYQTNEVALQLNAIVLSVLKDRQMGTVGRTPLISGSKLVSDKDHFGIYCPQSVVGGHIDNVGV